MLWRAPVEELSAATRFRRALLRRLPLLLALAVTALGLSLRIEHAITFDGPVRGSDYAAYVDGVRWMLAHKRAFNFDPTVSYPVRYQPPGWYAAAALVLGLTHSVRMIAALSVAGWLIRQFVLWRMLKLLAPATTGGSVTWSAALALTVHAVLPLSVLIDGKVNPEGPHATAFAVGCYLLLRMERQATQPAGIS
ncbi:MAG TPA: hypothetical protein VL137_08450, partial [Polyangiaceae bacterium]|nr:hypothetical protein [Polyangiaceae bacterium]